MIEGCVFEVEPDKIPNLGCDATFLHDFDIQSNSRPLFNECTGMKEITECGFTGIREADQNQFERATEEEGTEARKETTHRRRAEEDKLMSA